MIMRILRLDVVNIKIYPPNNNISETSSANRQVQDFQSAANIEFLCEVIVVVDN